MAADMLHHRQPLVNHRAAERLLSGKRRMAGVMLIEVLVSILIFSFGILGTVALYARAVQYSTNAEDRNRASLLANEIAATMLLRGTNDVTNASLQDDYDAWVARVNDSSTNGFLPGGEGSSTLVGRTATITIIWTPSFSATPQRLSTQVTM